MGVKLRIARRQIREQPANIVLVHAGVLEQAKYGAGVAESVGAQPILVLTGKGRGTQSEGGMPKKTLVFDDLAEASRHLISHA